MTKCNSCEWGDHTVGCDDGDCDCICYEWLNKFLDGDFFVRNLTANQGASLFTQAGIPLDLDEEEKPRGFGLVPRSSVSIIRRTEHVWTITWPGGEWTGKP